MTLNEHELRLFIGYLRQRRMYKPTQPVLGYTVWEPWMEDTLDKLTNELNDMPPMWGEGAPTY